MVGLIVLCAALTLRDETLRSLATGAFAALSWFLAAASAFARASEEPDFKDAWQLLGAAFTAWSGFALLSVVRLFGAPVVPFPPLFALWTTWVALILFGAAWLLFQDALRQDRGWIGLLLDEGNFLSAFLLGYWLLFLRAHFLRGAQAPLDRIAALGLVLGVVSLAGLFGRTASGYRGGMRGPLGFLGLGLLIMALNLPFVTVLLERKPFFGHPIHLTMIPVWLAFLEASRRPFPQATHAQMVGSVPFRDLFPYAPLAMTLPALFYTFRIKGEPLDPFAFGLLLVLISCLSVRQVLALLQVRVVNQTLEDRVEERTRELANLQSVLVRTERLNLLATLGAGAAHDINNLLTTALTCTELVETERGSLTGFARENLEHVHTSIEASGRLTRRLLSLGREGLGPAHFHAQERIHSLAPVLRALVPRRIDLQIQQEEGCCPLFVDPSAFDQVVVNLVSNAKDAISGPGQIRIRSFCESSLSCRFCLVVEDSGTGVPPEVRSRIFEPFFTTKSVGEGTGLGLSSTKVIIDGFGGDVEVDSQPGLGTSFRISIPTASC